MLSFFRRFAYALLGLALLPAIHACGNMIYHVLVHLQEHEASSQLMLWFVLGLAGWVIAFFLLPRPMRTYVLGHELSHALWAWMMGARVHKLRVGKDGGSVEVSETNLLITLAPYFFPFYTILILVAWAVASLFVDLRPYIAIITFVLGASWGFHICFTLLALSHSQSDIHRYGAVCAYPFIILANLAIVAISLAAISPVPLLEHLKTWADLTVEIYQKVFTFFRSENFFAVPGNN